MNRDALIQEVKDQGHNYGEANWDTRLQWFVNQGAKDILLDELWEQRRRTVAGVVPGALVPRLGKVKRVLRSSTQFVLEPYTVDELADDYPGPTPAGEPLYYYIVRNESISTWPTLATATIDVDHYDRACWTDAAGTTLKVESSAGTDVLVGGDVFEEAVILATRLRVLEEGDEDDLRAQLELRLRGADGAGGVMGQLRDRQLNLNVDEPTRIKQTRAWV